MVEEEVRFTFYREHFSEVDACYGFGKRILYYTCRLCNKTVEEEVNLKAHFKNSHRNENFEKMFREIEEEQIRDHQRRFQRFIDNFYQVNDNTNCWSCEGCNADNLPLKGDILQRVDHAECHFRQCHMYNAALNDDLIYLS